MDDFGIFDPVFKTAHGYLALLGLHSGDSREAVDLVRRCCEGNQEATADILKLLKEPNWRPHLVAAVAVIHIGYDVKTVEALWNRLDHGSWVTPQLAVALLLVDTEFVSKAKPRLEAGCPVNYSELLQMSALELHSAAGPAGKTGRSAKAAAALLRLVEMVSQEDWVTKIRESVEMQELLAKDEDGSDFLAEKWLARIRALTT